MSSKEPKVMNRWIPVLGAIVIQFCLGAIYAWSVFTKPLVDAGWTKTQTQVVFSVGLAVFAVVMVLAGRLMPKFGPRKIAISGGLVLGLGYLLAGLTGGTNFWMTLIGIGMIGGAGIGLGYVVPIAVGMRWFPDKKGLVTGLAVAGFGFGAMLWVKLAGEWGHLLHTIGLSGTFTLYGIVFAVAVILGGIVMIFPPQDWKPKGWNPPTAAPGKTVAGSVDLSSKEMLKTPQYFLILLTFAFAASAGLMSIGLMKLFPMEALIKAQGKDPAAIQQAAQWTAPDPALIPKRESRTLKAARLAEEQRSREESEKAKDLLKWAGAIAGTAMAIFYSLANGLGRIGWGWISDKIGRKPSLVLMQACQGVVVLLFPLMAGHEGWLYLGATLIGFNFGGNFALFPTITADTFGAKFIGQNYGWVFLAYGVGGVFGPILGGKLGDLGNFPLAFTICGILCLVAAGLIAMVRPMAKKA